MSCPDTSLSGTNYRNTGKAGTRCPYRVRQLRTLAWQTLLEKNGVINSILAFFHLPQQSIINTPGAIVLGMVYNFLPSDRSRF